MRASLLLLSVLLFALFAVIATHASSVSDSLAIADQSFDENADVAALEVEAETGVDFYKSFNADGTSRLGHAEDCQ